jgi:hypothetical protein
VKKIRQVPSKPGLGLIGWNELAPQSNVILPLTEGRRENLTMLSAQPDLAVQAFSPDPPLGRSFASLRISAAGSDAR